MPKAGGPDPLKSEYMYLADQHGHRIKWQIGEGGLTADQMIARLGPEADRVQLKNHAITIFFPMKPEGYVMKKYYNQPKLTLARIVRLIQDTAYAAAAYSMGQRGAKKVYEHDARRFLKGVTVAGLYPDNRGGHNHVYVRLEGDVPQFIEANR